MQKSERQLIKRVMGMGAFLPLAIGGVLPSGSAQAAQAGSSLPPALSLLNALFHHRTPAERSPADVDPVCRKSCEQAQIDARSKCLQGGGRRSQCVDAGKMALNECLVSRCESQFGLCELDCDSLALNSLYTCLAKGRPNCREIVYSTWRMCWGGFCGNAIREGDGPLVLDGWGEEGPTEPVVVPGCKSKCAKRAQESLDRCKRFAPTAACEQGAGDLKVGCELTCSGAGPSPEPEPEPSPEPEPEPSPEPEPEPSPEPEPEPSPEPEPEPKPEPTGRSKEQCERSCDQRADRSYQRCRSIGVANPICDKAARDQRLGCKSRC